MLSRRSFLAGLPLAWCDVGRPLMKKTSVLEPFAVFVGDSLTFGTSSTNPGGSTSYPARYAAKTGLTYGVDAINFGIPSQGVFDFPDVRFLAEPGRKNRMFLQGGTNNVHAAGESGDDTFDQLQVYYERMSEAFAITVNTIEGQGNVDPTGDAQALVLCNRIRSEFPSVCDIAANEHIGVGAPWTAPYCNDGDGVHLLDPGYDLKADLEVAVPEPSGGIISEQGADWGVVRDPNLQMWLRDFFAVSPTIVPNEVHGTAGDWFNLATLSTLSRYVSASGVWALRILNALNGWPAVRFSNELYLTSGEDLADYITASEFTIELVGKVSSVSSSSANAYANHGILSDSNNNLSVTVRTGGGTGMQIQATVYDGSDFRSTAVQSIPNNTYFRARVELYGGNLYLSVNGAAPLSIATGNISDLTGALRFGKAAGGNNFTGDLVDVRVYNNRSSSRNALNDTYDLARYFP